MADELDEFSAAFAELQSGKKPEPEPAPEPTSADPAPAEPVPEPTPAPAEPTPTPAEPAPAEPAPTPAANPWEAELAALRAELAELKTAPAEPEPEPAPAPAEPAPLYNADEQAILQKYFEEWPDVAKGEALQRRAEYRALIDYVFQQLEPQFDQLRQLQGYYEHTSVSTQYRDIVALVPDYDAVREPVLAWIDQQPAYLKNAYQQVANEGSAQDVADLIGRYKKESGYVVPATPGTAAPAPAAPASPAAAAPAAPAPAALPSAATAALAALKPVKSGRSEPTSTPDPNDFDSAFKEFASAG